MSFLLGYGRLVWLAVAIESLILARASMSINDVIETLSSADEAVLLGIGPFGDGLRNGVIDRNGAGLIVGVFKAERSGVLSRSFDTVYSVIIRSAFREKYS